MKLFGLKCLQIFFFALLFANSTFSKETDSRCSDEIYDAVGRHLKIAAFAPRNQNGIVVSESCKSWPYKNNLVLAAFAYDKGVEYEKSLFVVILDKQNLRVISSYKDVIGEDAITEVGETSLRIDTGKFQLSKDARAFGLRFTNSSRGPSCGDGASWDTLTLLAQEKKKLRPVLRMDMQNQKALSGCIGSATGHDISEYGKKVISIEKTMSNGFADLLITETITVHSNTDDIPNDINTRARIQRSLAKYNGREYIEYLR